MTDVRDPNLEPWAGHLPTTAREFAHRLRRGVETGGKYAFLVGAGASVSSGIPAGRELTEAWLRDLHRHAHAERSPAADVTEIVDWARSRYGWKISPASLGTSYSTVIETLFPSRRARQQELHRLCSNAQPHASYVALALLAGGESAPAVDRPLDALSVVLTTNFDDLVAVAMYRWAQRRPRVISDVGLARFAAADLNDPVIVHLHGAYQTAQANTKGETHRLDKDLCSSLSSLLSERELIVVGYSGRDQGVTDLLSEIYAASACGITWVSRDRPEIDRGLEEALNIRSNGQWVQCRDADEFFYELNLAFELSLDRLQALDRETERVRRQWRDVASKAGAAGAEPTENRVEQSVGRSERWPNETQALADALAAADREEAALLWSAASAQFPKSPWILGNYAIFCKDKLGNTDRAAELYERALDAAPKNPDLLNSYATFLTTGGGNPQRAQELFEQAYATDPENADLVGNFAAFAYSQGDVDRADALFRRALDHPKCSGGTVANYANFVARVRSDFQQAERLYLRAIDIDRSSASILSNYAIFLAQDLEDLDRSIEVFERAIELEPTDPKILSNYALIEERRGHPERAAVLLERALGANPDDPLVHSRLGFLLAETDRHRAREILESGVAANPYDGDMIGNLAVFEQVDRPAEAERLYQRAIDADPRHANNLMNYAGFRVRQFADIAGAVALSARAVSAAPGEPLLRVRYGSVLAQAGDVSTAKNQLDEAVRLAPQDPRVLAATGTVFGGIDDLDAAASVFRRAAQLAPDNSDVLSGYAVVLASLGEFERSMALHARAEAGAPDNPNYIANHAGSCLLAGDKQRGLRLLASARDKAQGDGDRVLETELAIYAWVFGSPRQRDRSKTLVTKAIADGIRSPWFLGVLSAARTALLNRHPDAAAITDAVQDFTAPL